MKTIDINCDVGEGIENEELLMPYVSSCNIACGGHYGDENTIRKTIELALHNKVKIGAHPSFPDTENFGRKIMDISFEDLKDSIESQLNLIMQQLDMYHVKLHHIKAHGALYNLIAKDTETASVYLDAIEKYAKNSYLFVPYNSVIDKLAQERNFKVNYEAFADRNYNSDLSLVARTTEKALLTDSKSVLNHVMHMIQNNAVRTIENTDVPILVDTFCIHGDHKNAFIILKELTSLLKKQNIKIA